VTVLPIQGDTNPDPAPAAEPPAGTGPADEHADESANFELPPLKEILNRFATEPADPFGVSEAAEPVEDSEHQDDVLLERARMLRMTRVPPGVPVEETNVGRAFGQWILAVRCECGRRWFEVEPIYRAQCPKCGKIVFLEVDGAAE
jgi:hypothetical protein